MLHVMFNIVFEKNQNKSIDANDNSTMRESMRLQCNRTCAFNTTLPITTHQDCDQTPTASLSGCMFCMSRTMQQKSATSEFAPSNENNVLFKFLIAR